MRSQLGIQNCSRRNGEVAAMVGQPTAGLDRLLSVHDVAFLFGASERTIRYWAEVGELPGFKVGKHWRFWQRKILAHLEEAESSWGA